MLTYYSVAFVPAGILFAVFRQNFDWIRYLAIVVSIYLPATQGFFYEGTHCRKMWPELFPVASGFVPAIWGLRFFDFDRMGSEFDYVLSAVVMIMAVVVFYFLAGINKVCFIVAMIMSFVFSAISSFWLAALLHA